MTGMLLVLTFVHYKKLAFIVTPNSMPISQGFQFRSKEKSKMWKYTHPSTLLFPWIYYCCMRSSEQHTAVNSYFILLFAYKCALLFPLNSYLSYPQIIKAEFVSVQRFFFFKKTLCHQPQNTIKQRVRMKIELCNNNTFLGVPFLMHWFHSFQVVLFNLIYTLTGT